jgi:glycosyltransferase involved in cell wall biosynthesis
MFCGLAAAFNVPFVLHLHSGEFPSFYLRECGPFRRAWIRLVLRRAFRVVVLTPGWQAELVKIEPAAKVTVIGNPVVVPPALSRMRAEARNVLFLGRLRQKKGVYDLIAAVPEVLRHRPESRFVIAGDGEIDLVNDLAARLRVGHVIVTPGWVDGKDKDRLFEAADVLVLPSYYEGLPICVLEAMALGVPIVCTPVGGISGLIEHGANGLLVSVGNPAQLAQTLVRCLTDSNLRERLRRAAYYRVSQDYEIKRVLAKLEGLYREAGVPVSEFGGSPAVQ